MNNETIVNFDLLEEYEEMLGLEALYQMSTLYEDSFKVYFTELTQALSNDCCLTWGEHCHRLKGATSSMGFMRFTDYLNQIENKEFSEHIQNPYIDTILGHHNEAIKTLKVWLESR